MIAINKRIWLAMGSLMEFWPVRDYTAYQPHGTVQKRVGRHWSAAGMYINQARERHDRERNR